MNINRNNYEEFLVLYIDGELNEQEQQEVDKFIGDNQDLKGELEHFRSFKLTPPEHLFTDKQSLYRSTEHRKVIPVFRWEYAAAVIAVAVVIGLITAGIISLERRSAPVLSGELADKGNIAVKEKGNVAIKEPKAITTDDMPAFAAIATKGHRGTLKDDPDVVKADPETVKENMDALKDDPGTAKADPKAGNPATGEVKEADPVARHDAESNISNSKSITGTTGKHSTDDTPAALLSEMPALTGRQLEIAQASADGPLTRRNSLPGFKVDAVLPEMPAISFPEATQIAVTSSDNSRTAAPQEYIQSRKNAITKFLRKTSGIINNVAELKNTQEVRIRFGQYEIALH